MPAFHEPSEEVALDDPPAELAGLRRSAEDPAADPPYDAVIIGAGIAGLTVAHRLNRAGNRALVLEASEHAGGAIRTCRDGDFLVECGPNTVLDTHPEVGTLIEEAGLGEERIAASKTAKKRFVVRGGKPVPMPMNPPALIRTSLFSTRAKLRLAAEPFIRRADPAREESVAEFVRRRLGREFLDYAIDPFVSGVYAGRPEGLSVRHAFPRLEKIEQQYGSLIVGQIRGARERKRRAEKPRTSAEMFTFRDGLDRLPDALASRLGDAVRTGCPVTGFSRHGSGWNVEYTDAAGFSRTARSGSVVYCGGLNKTDLLDSLGPETKFLKSVHYPPLCVAALGFRREDVGHPLDGFGLLVPSIEKMNILGALFSSTLFEGRAPDGHVLLTAFVGGSRQPELAVGDDASVIRTAVNDLKRLLEIKGRSVFSHVTRWPSAIPQYNVGYGDVKEALSSLEKRHPGLYFAGNFRSGISVPDTIRFSSELSGSIVRYITEYKANSS